MNIISSFYACLLININFKEIILYVKNQLNQTLLAIIFQSLVSFLLQQKIKRLFRENVD